MNTHTEQEVKQYTMCLEYQHTQPKERPLHYKIPCRSWEMVSADIFMVNNKTFDFAEDYYHKFPNIKKVGSLSAVDLVQMVK